MKNTNPTTYTVSVEDTWPAPGTANRTVIGKFATYDEALAHAQKRVRDYLVKDNPSYPDNDEAVSYHYHWGEDVWISPTPEGVQPFSTRTYIDEIVGSPELAKARRLYAIEERVHSGIGFGIPFLSTKKQVKWWQLVDAWGGRFAAICAIAVLLFLIVLAVIVL